jgi:hypothetical protein
VLTFFIAGLLYLLCFKHVDNLGAYSIPSETGLLIPSVIFLGVANLPKEQKVAIGALVFGKTDSDDCVADGRSRQQELDMIRVAEVKLTLTSESYLLVEASDPCHCGATGNCSFWVLRRKVKAFDVLLATHMVQTFSVDGHFTHGFRDLKTFSHVSASESGSVLYRFNGAEYRATECAHVRYELDENRRLVPSIITKVDCMPAN